MSASLVVGLAIVSLVICIVFLIAFFKDFDHILGFMSGMFFLVFGLLMTWISNANTESQENVKYVEYKVYKIDNVSVINMDGFLVNLNEKFRREFKEGDIVYYKQFPFVNGLDFSAGNNLTLEKDQ